MPYKDITLRQTDMNLLERKIKLEVHTQNDFFRIIKAELANLLPQLEQYMNKKVFKADGLSKRFVVNFLKTEPVKFGERAATHQGCFITSEYGTIRVRIRVCYCHESGCEYMDRTIELGKLQNFDTLVSVDKIEDIVNSYKFDRVLDEAKELANVQEYIRVNAEMNAKLKELRSQIGVSYDLYRNE